MRAAVILGTMLLLTAGLASAGESGVTVDATEPATGADIGETACAATKALPENEPLFAAWAEEHGFARVLSAAESASAAACPAIISCNATHCIETTFCATQDTGNNSCCISSGACLLCPSGQTIHVRKCRCAGGGCVNPNSQTFFCA